MDFKKEFQQIKENIEEKEVLQSNVEYVKAKAEAEAKETALIAQDPTKALKTKLSLEMANHIDNSQVVKQKISDTADKLVDKGLQEQENIATAEVTLSEDKIIEADYLKNKNEYLYHGIDHKIDAKWKRAILLRINDIWFVIWAVISCFTIVPVSTFLSRIKALNGIVRGVAIVIGILLLLACLGGITYALLRACGVFG